MIIWKNISGKSVSLYHIGKLIAPDQTFKSNGLFYPDMTEESYDLSSFKDFAQPIVKSQISTIDNSEVVDVFIAGSNITIEEFAETERLMIAITGATNQYVAAPNDMIKVFINLHTHTDLSVAPFSYLMSPVFEYNNIKHWLKRLTIQNTSGMAIKVFVQAQRFNEFDTN